MTCNPLLGCLTSEKRFQWQKWTFHDTHPSPGCVPGGVGNVLPLPRTSYASSGLTSRWTEHACYLIYRLGCMSSARIFNIIIFRTGLGWETLNADSVRPSLPYDLVTLGWAWKSLVCNMNHFGVIKNLNYKLVWFRRRNTCYEVSIETLTFIDKLTWYSGFAMVGDKSKLTR